MSDRLQSTVLPWVVLGVAVALFVGWAIWPGSALYSQVLTPHRLIALGALLKLVYLLAGTAWAFACRDRLEEGNPARPAWFLLSLGLLSNFAGQLCLAPFQVLRAETPFPSVADIYYLLAYPLLIAALLVLLNAYRESGFPVGSPAERTAIVGVVAVIAAFVAVPILRPVMLTGGPLLDRILTVAYPVLDLVLLLPLALLLRVALRLRGSRAGEVWLLIVSGFVFLCAGDICFAYFQSLGEAHLDPFVHATFTLAYGLIAGGAHRQLQLLKS
jgi:diguanylate cyclase